MDNKEDFFKTTVGGIICYVIIITIMWLSPKIKNERVRLLESYAIRVVNTGYAEVVAQENISKYSLVSVGRLQGV